MTIRTLAFVVVSILISSCSEPTASDSLDVSNSNTTASFELDRTHYRTARGETVADNADVTLWNRNTTFGVNGGRVYLSGTELPWLGAPYQNYTPAGERLAIPLYFDGRYHVFTVSGSSEFAAMSDSIRSPGAPLTVISPTPIDTISRSAGFTILWNATGAEAAYVWISDTSRTIGHQNFATSTDDDGSLTLTPSDLSTLIEGPINVAIYCGNHKSVHGANGRDYDLRISESYIVFLNLKP